MNASLAAPKIAEVFDRCRAQGRAAFIPFLMAGDPDAATSEQALVACALSGADIIEIGIPFSDPLADGPVIQQATRRALDGGMTFRRTLALCRRLHVRLGDTPLVAFTYYNPVFVRGLDRAANELAAAGFSGIVCADLPLDEAGPLLQACREAGLGVTLLVAPTTPARRAAAIAAHCTDFVYVVSRVGVTGARTVAGEQLRARIAELRELVRKPLAVGFGVATPDQAAELAALSDGIVVGSALIQQMTRHTHPQEAMGAIGALCARMAAACRRKTQVVGHR